MTVEVLRGENSEVIGEGSVALDTAIDFDCLALKVESKVLLERIVQADDMSVFLTMEPLDGIFLVFDYPIIEHLMKPFADGLACCIFSFYELTAFGK